MSPLAPPAKQLVFDVEAEAEKASKAPEAASVDQEPQKTSPLAIPSTWTGASGSACGVPDISGEMPAVAPVPEVDGKCPLPIGEDDLFQALMTQQRALQPKEGDNPEELEKSASDSFIALRQKVASITGPEQELKPGHTKIKSAAEGGPAPAHGCFGSAFNRAHPKGSKRKQEYDKCQSKKAKELFKRHHLVRST